MFQTLPNSTRRAAALLVAFFALSVPAPAAQFAPSQTFKAGTKINCVLDETINSATTVEYADFKLRVTDPSHPALEGAEVHGYVTVVTQPSGMNRARISFLLTKIHFSNGTKKPIHAFVVNRGVVQYNPAAQQAQRNMPPPMPNGFTTPGPVAWQMNFGSGGASVSNRPTTAVGGTIYAANAHEPIVIHAGTAVTIQLTADLTIP
ncbi:MAG: hypothetical protein JOZ77_03025 [Candidatus Eremiobacteraeota bacterium]|nr:hypothetical protein [Candidatus Eremiobacteraeota bacterium]